MAAPMLPLRMYIRWLVVWAVLAIALAAAASAPAGSAAGAASDDDGSCSGDAAGDKPCGGSQDGDNPDPHVRRIIHATSLVAALADGGLAQLPLVGSAVVVPTIQAAMVGLIGSHYGCHMDAGSALAVVTWLASGHAKKAMFKEIIGYIPLAGNVVKATITGFMTEGIGNLANGMLRCPTASQDFFKKANIGSENVQKASDSAKHLYHAVSDYLGNAGLSSVSADEAWQRARLIFSTRSQAEMLAEIEEAPEASSLAAIVRKHAWNLEILTAALGALTRRFPEDKGACMMVDFVAERLWAPAGSDIEVRSAVAPYLLTCLPHATAETRRSLALASAQLLVDTRGGSKGGLSARAIQQTLELVTVTAEERAAEMDQMAESDFASDGWTVPPVLPTSTIISSFSAAMSALQAGQGAACGALRAILRAEAAAAASAGAGIIGGSTVASVRHLELLARMEAPVGAEICLPSLRVEIQGLLTLAALPANVEWPGAAVAPDVARRAPRGRGQLEDALGAAVVGQRCAIERLAKRPGFARLKMRGLWADKPLVFLLTGPSGTGKTLMGRTLGEELLGRPISELEATGRFRTFHMNIFSLVEDQKSFFGPPKGIQGVGDLPELLKQWPDAVILLDEVEKAHPSFARALLKVFGEHGAVYDPRTGQDVSTVNATFILTSNLAKDLIAEQTEVAMRSADTDFDCTGYGALRENVMNALRTPFIRGRDNFFKESEVRGRLTDILPFLPFGMSDVEAAVRRFLVSEAAIFKRSPEFLHASLSWEPQVVPFLASGYARQPEEGLRGVHTQLQAKVREVFECAIEAKLLERSGEVVLRLQPGSNIGLDLRVLPPRLASTRLAPSSPSGALSGTSADTHATPASSWWPLDMLGLSSSDASSGSPASWQLPSLSGESPSSGDGAPQREWERIHDWDWQVFWVQIREILWDYWPLVVISSVALLAAIGTSAPLAISASAPLAAPAFAAPAAACASPSAAAAAAASIGAVSAAPWVTSILAGLQLVVPIGTTAVAAVSAAHVWQNRHMIAAVAALTGLTMLMLPSLLKMLWRASCRKFAAAWRSDEPPAYRSPRKQSRRLRPKSMRYNEDAATPVESGAVSSSIEEPQRSSCPDRRQSREFVFFSPEKRLSNAQPRVETPDGSDRLDGSTNSTPPLLTSPDYDERAPRSGGSRGSAPSLLQAFDDAAAPIGSRESTPSPPQPFDEAAPRACEELVEEESRPQVRSRALEELVNECTIDDLMKVADQESRARELLSCSRDSTPTGFDELSPRSRLQEVMCNKAARTPGAEAELVVDCPAQDEQ